MTRSTDSIRRDLLNWFSEHRRPLAWRESKDPYRIWISEIMLQQTTVRAVEPRWRRFLERFPTLAALASAEADEVVAEWSGLGYYARARHLHEAARRVCRDFGGQLPERFELLLALPGMGNYTAAAVASIAFGEPVAAVDANVERVVARLNGLEENVRSATGRRKVQEGARLLLDAARPGIWNEAMMELGAVVCLARAPQCRVCPLAGHCVARESGRPEAYPPPRERAPMREVREVAIVVRRQEHVLVLRRPARGSFADMWEVPRGETLEGERSQAAAARVLREATGLDGAPGGPVLRLQHVVMRRRIRLEVFALEFPGGRVRRKHHAAHEWIPATEWMGRAISKSQRDIAAFLAEGRLPGGCQPLAIPPQDHPDLFDSQGEAP